MRHQSGFAVIEAVLIFVIVALVAGTGFYVWHSNQTTNKTLSTTSSQTTPSKTTQPAADPTSNWAAYTSTTGKFSLKYPKTWVIASHPELCSDGLLLLGANSASVGTCASEDSGQILVWGDPGYGPCGQYQDGLGILSSEAVTVSGVSGTKITASTKASDAQGPGAPAGTKVIQYCFAASGITYLATYTQLASYPDALADFNTMITKTLKFN